MKILSNIYRIAGISALAAAGMIFGAGIRMTHAQTAPQIGVQVFSNGACTSRASLQALTPANGGDSFSVAPNGASEFHCGAIYFTNTTIAHDFRIAMRLGNGSGCNWGAWQYTNWASQGGGWSPWAGGVAQDDACVQLRLEINPNPSAVSYKIVASGFAWDEHDNGWQGDVGTTVFSAGSGAKYGYNFTPNYWQGVATYNGGSELGKIYLGVQQVAAAQGTVNVVSQNSVQGGIQVPASWDIVYGATDMCSSGVTCSGASMSYQNQPANTAYTLASAVLASGYAAAYQFDHIETVPIVQNANQHKTIAELLKEFSKNIFAPSASASTCASAPNCYGSSYTVSAPSQFLPANGAITFVILWNPVANMSLSQNAWSPSAQSGGGSATQSITISNSGAPGSKLTWNSSSNASWLTASPSSDGSGLTNGISGSASENITVSANPSGLSLGAHTGTITFTGISTPGAGSTPPTQTLTVTLNVTAGPVTGVTVTCSPTSVYGNGTSTCAATVSGQGSFSNAVTWSTNNGSITSAGKYTAPGTAGSAVITATSVQDPSKSASAVITVLPPLCTAANGCVPASCAPSLSAAPGSIVVPESSNLFYYCDHVTSCNLTGGGLNVTTTATGSVVSSTQSVAPSQTTTYTLTCTNTNYSLDSVSSQVKVIVGGPGQCEQNPNGVGCPKP